MRKLKRKLSKKSKLFKRKSKSHKKKYGGMGPSPTSDEELARKLQESFDQEQLSIGLQVSGDELLAQQMMNDYLRDNDIELIEPEPIAGSIEEEPKHIYRALRTEEAFTLVNRGALLPPCTPCPEAGACCDITPNAHINSGSKAKVKSRWISTTQSVECAALWSSNRPSGSGEVTRLPSDMKATSSGIFAKIKTDGLVLIDPIELELGATAENNAMASSEILIKDKIPGENISQLFMSKQVNKSEWDAHKGLKVSGKRKLSSSKLYVIYTPLEGSKKWQDALKQAIIDSMQSHFDSYGMEM